MYTCLYFLSPLTPPLSPSSPLCLSLCTLFMAHSLYISHSLLLSLALLLALSLSPSLSHSLSLSLALSLSLSMYHTVCLSLMVQPLLQIRCWSVVLYSQSAGCYSKHICDVHFSHCKSRMNRTCEELQRRENAYMNSKYSHWNMGRWIDGWSWIDKVTLIKCFNQFINQPIYET